tara:strand:+ start:1235 stop:4957 length:3723 start_codon:yes stop_codon:yes gene_type:complete
MATDHNFRVKNGLEVGGSLIVNPSGQLVASNVNGNLKFADDIQAQFGANSDLKIYHDPNNSFILHSNTSGYFKIGAGTKELFLHGNRVDLRSETDNEAMLQAFHNGALKLYHGGDLKLETTSSGIQVTGNISATTAAYFPIIYGGSTGLQLKSNTGEFFANFTNNAGASLYADNVEKLRTETTGITVYSPHGNVEIGAKNTSGLHIYTDRNQFYFNKEINLITNAITSYDNDFLLKRTGSTKLTLTSTGASVTGDLSVSGDLNITGDINAVSVNDLDVVDKTITVGQGQAASNSTGSGLVVSGPNANMLWHNDNNRWEFNKDIYTSGYIDLGNNTIYASGDSNSIHLNAVTAIIGPSTTTANNPSLGLSTYRWNGLFSSTGSFSGTVSAAGNVYLATSSGNVGVGTSSASSKLTVEGDIRQTAGDLLYQGGGNWDIKHLADDQNILFYTSQSGSATEKLRIRSDGRVGINNSSPAGTLHIKSLNNVGDAILIVEADNDNNVEGDNPRIELRQDGNNVAGYLYVEGEAGQTATGTLANTTILESKGTSNGQGIHFVTGGRAPAQSGGALNGTVRMTILGNGNVGIGTTGPNEFLHLSRAGDAGLKLQNTSSSQILRIDQNSIRTTSSSPLTIFTNGNASQLKLDQSTGNIGMGVATPDEALTVRMGNYANNQDGGIAIQSGDESGNHWKSAFKIKSDSNGVMRTTIDTSTGQTGGQTREAISIDTAGEVGIGISTPATALHVNGTAIRVGNSPFADLKAQQLYASLAFNFASGNNSFWHFANSSNAAQVSIDVGNTRVGIGTSSPSDGLHIASGNILLNNAIELRSKDTGGSVRTVTRVNSSNELEYGWSGNGPVKFMGGGSYTERMRIHTNGQVGINQDNPGQTLDVGGIIRSYSTNPQVRIHTSSGTGTGYLVFGDSADDDVGQIYYSHANERMNFKVGADVKMRIQSNDLIVVGNRTIDFNTDGGVSTKAQLIGDRSTTDLDSRAFTTEGGFSYTTFDNNTSNEPSHTSNNANGVITLNTHNGSYNHQLAFTNLGNIAHRWRNAGGFVAWANLITTRQPNAPSITSTTSVNETIEIVFSQSTASNQDSPTAYEVWSDGGTGDFSLIARIPTQDIASSMSVVDSSFDDSGTIAYRIYAIKHGVYSTAATTTHSFTMPSLDVSNMSVVPDINSFKIQYELPNTRFLDHVEIYMDAEASNSNLARSGASLIYSGKNPSYCYSISSSDMEKYHQFWVECVSV